MPSNRKIITLIILLILVGIGVYVIYFKDEQNPIMQNQDNFNQTMEATKLYTDAQQSNSAGNPSDAEKQFREVIKNSKSIEEIAKAKLQLASILSETAENSENDTEVTNLLKEVAFDTEVPLYVRALAYNSIATYIEGFTPSVYQLYFPEKVFKDFLPETGSDVYKMAYAYKKTLELSLSLYPTSFAYYSLAGNYTSSLSSFSNNTRLDKVGQESPEAIAQLMQDYISKGDALEDEKLQSPHVNARKYHIRAMALNVSGRQLKHSFDERESGFKKVLAYGQPYVDAGNKRVEAIILQSRFFFAVLMLQDSVTARSEDIQNILRPYGSLVTSDDYVYQKIKGFFTEKYTSSSGNAVKEHASKLADISPEFKSFLSQIGY